MSRNTLPAAIQQYFDGANAFDPEVASALFDENAVVHDEGHDHVGRAAIRSWVQDTIDRYATQLTIETTNVSADAIVVSVKMTGSFPGSPARVRFMFQLADGLITHLDIAP